MKHLYALHLVVFLFFSGNTHAQQPNIIPATHDFGDAPHSTYQTILQHDGARHLVVYDDQQNPVPRLGEQVDVEPDGQPQNEAMGDDQTLTDDEDGVEWLAPTEPGGPFFLRIHATGPGYLHAWMDLNRNHLFDPEEKIIPGLTVAPGPQNLEIPLELPENLPEGPLYFRFRITTLEDLPPFGEAPDGEVEDYYWFYETTQNELDFGDAPDGPDFPLSYPTLLINNGARHIISQGIFLGLHSPPDPEVDGQPDPLAKGDDLADGHDDEDGVSFVSALVPGTSADLQVRATVASSEPGYLNAWIDFNADGDWDDPGEQIFMSQPLSTGSHTLSFPVPADAKEGHTYSRFRFSHFPELSYVDIAEDGEVEDYKLAIDPPEQNLDWGDAPDDPADPNDYATLSVSNGPAHVIVPTIYLGAQGMPDSEPDGQPEPDAQGDDLLDGNDDEDGVAFLSSLIPGSPAQISVTAYASGVVGVLNAWIDFNGDGSFGASSEHIVLDQPLGTGVHNLTFVVPPSARPGKTMARFRFSTIRGLAPTGMAENGEVEDYAVTIGETEIGMDLGDLPDPSFTTLIVNDGARHIVPDKPFLFLGQKVDTEPDGQPNADASGDDIIDQSDDEDGVTMASALYPGQSATIKVEASSQGFLNAWIDFDQDGSFQKPEKIFHKKTIPGGTSLLSVQIPPYALAGETFARFRFSSTDNLHWTGLAPDGEVEDYKIVIEPQEEEKELDFGDAPDNGNTTAGYQTLLINNGARHVIREKIFLGDQQEPDDETDGQPDAMAMGDDNNDDDDEDGVLIPTPLIPGSATTWTVKTTAPANLPCFLNAWLDINQDGDWHDRGEHIIVDKLYATGTHTISLTLPPMKSGVTFARFRYSSVRGLKSFGAAPNGEVEDYQLEIGEQEDKWDFGDLPDQPYPTLLANDGARHLYTHGFWLGDTCDTEPDGHPDAMAMGDDNHQKDDEDGVWIPSALPTGTPVTIKVKVHGNGKLNAWMDFDQDGVLENNAEHILIDKPVSTGMHSYSITVPANATAGQSYARFRLNRDGNLTPNGPAREGEVEDYAIEIKENDFQWDFGDLPDRAFRTLLSSDGPRHIINPDIFMGAKIDAEPDGQPSADADGDDLNNIDDEDGVLLSSVLVQGNKTNIEIKVSQDGFVNAWFDWNNNQRFDPFGERVLINEPASMGSNTYTILVPKWAEPGRVAARFRYATTKGLGWFGPAKDGEVEDYIFALEQGEFEWDFGDLPDEPYPTLLVSDGARHRHVKGLHLGRRIDADADGQPDAKALGDDRDGVDDEDGVIFRSMPTDPQKIGLTVLASAEGYLNAWIDWNSNGSFGDTDDQICMDKKLVPGANHIVVAIPHITTEARLYARFRFNSDGGLTWKGAAEDGEVEDYILLFNNDTPPEWSVPLDIQLLDKKLVQVFGVHPQATDDYDPDLDELAPPPTPDGLYAFFECPVNETFDLQTDLRSPTIDPDTKEIRWQLHIINSGSTVLAWDPSSLPARGSLVMETQSGSKKVNMRAQESMMLQGNQVVIIRYRLAQAVSFEFRRQGWHMISLPVIPGSNKVADLFPNLYGNEAYFWDPVQGKYLSVTDLEPGKGYWLPIQDAASIDINGEALDFIHLSLKPGWNMIGAPFDIARVVADPPDGIIHQFIEYDEANGTYEVAQHLQATKGYWVWAKQECELFIYSNNSENMPKRVAPEISGWDNQMPPPPPFEITDVESNQHQPRDFKVIQNYPNPFNPETTITYRLAGTEQVRVEVFNMKGELLRTLVNEHQSMGTRSVVWDGRDDHGQHVSSGIYFIKVTAGTTQQTIKAMLLK